MTTPSKPILQAVDELPASSLTVLALQGLDFVVPGQWTNVVGFDNTARAVAGDQDPARLAELRQKVQRLYDDPALGYQRTLWLYQTVDVVDMALGTAALAQKAADKIPFLSFMSRLTPKADTSQAIDLALKLIVEGLAFATLKGVSPQNFGEFTAALQSYAGGSLMRLAALVCLDGVVPLGPDFVLGTQDILRRVGTSDLQNNALFQRVGDLIPGAGAGAKLGFINEGFGAAQGWLSQFVASRNLNPGVVLGSLRRFIDIADDQLDYVGAFLDLTTNYYAHTGTQTVAQHLIQRAMQ